MNKDTIPVLRPTREINMLIVLNLVLQNLPEPGDERKT